MDRPSGTALRQMALVLFVIAVITGIVVYNAVSDAFGYSDSPDPTDYLPLIGMVSGPWLIASLVAWAGGLTVDAVMYGKPRVAETDTPPSPPMS